MGCCVQISKSSTMNAAISKTMTNPAASPNSGNHQTRFAVTAIKKKLKTKEEELETCRDKIKV